MTAAGQSSFSARQRAAPPDERTCTHTHTHEEKDDKLSTVIQMMSEVMNKLMEVDLELKQKVEDNVVKELQSN